RRHFDMRGLSSGGTLRQPIGVVEPAESNHFYLSRRLVLGHLVEVDGEIKAGLSFQARVIYCASLSVAAIPEDSVLTRRSLELDRKSWVALIDEVFLLLRSSLTPPGVCGLEMKGDQFMQQVPEHLWGREEIFPKPKTIGTKR